MPAEPPPRSFDQALAREILASERLRVTILIAILGFLLVLYVVVPVLFPAMLPPPLRERFPVSTAVFEFMVDIVNRHHGIVNKFLGDGFMAVFGAPIADGRNVQNGVAAAMEILARVEERNASAHIQPTRIGIGLHAGHWRSPPGQAGRPPRGRASWCSWAGRRHAPGPVDDRCRLGVASRHLGGGA